MKYLYIKFDIEVSGGTKHILFMFCNFFNAYKNDFTLVENPSMKISSFHFNPHEASTMYDMFIKNSYDCTMNDLPKGRHRPIKKSKNRKNGIYYILYSQLSRQWRKGIFRENINFVEPTCKSYFNTNKTKVFVHMRRGDCSIIDPKNYSLATSTDVSFNKIRVQKRVASQEKYKEEIIKLDPETHEIIVFSNGTKTFGRNYTKLFNYTKNKMLFEKEFLEEQFGKLYELKHVKFVIDSRIRKTDKDIYARTIKSYIDCDLFIGTRMASMLSIVDRFHPKPKIVLPSEC